MKIWRNLERIEDNKANIITFLDNMLFNTGFQAVLIDRISNLAFRYKIPDGCILGNRLGYDKDIQYGQPIVGDNSVVLIDVPNGCTAFGSPARIINKKEN